MRYQVRAWEAGEDWSEIEYKATAISAVEEFARNVGLDIGTFIEVKDNGLFQVKDVEQVPAYSIIHVSYEDYLESLLKAKEYFILIGSKDKNSPPSFIVNEDESVMMFETKEEAELLANAHGFCQSFGWEIFRLGYGESGDPIQSIQSSI